MQGKTVDPEIAKFRDKIKGLLAVNSDWLELQEEFDLLYDRSLDDPPMAMARARRLVEVFIVDAYVGKEKPLEPYDMDIRKKGASGLIKCLKKTDMNKNFISMCSELWSWGNDVLHYGPSKPGDTRKAKVTDKRLLGTWKKLAQIVEEFTTGGYTIYVSVLPKPFDSMYVLLRQDWAPELARKRIDAFPLNEALDLLFRSVTGTMEPKWLNVLEKYNQDGTLAHALTDGEEAALRGLRNLGLIRSDKQSLFTPIRSTIIEPTTRGQFLLALYSHQGFDQSMEQLAIEVIEQLSNITHDSSKMSLLRDIRMTRRYLKTQEKLVRELRNSALITHPSERLATTDEVTLTSLGHYVVDQIDASGAVGIIPPVA